MQIGLYLCSLQSIGKSASEAILCITFSDSMINGLESLNNSITNPSNFDLLLIPHQGLLNFKNVKIQ